MTTSRSFFLALLTAVFFCSTGWVYSTWAAAEDPVLPADLETQQNPPLALSTDSSSEASPPPASLQEPSPAARLLAEFAEKAPAPQASTAGSQHNALPPSPTPLSPVPAGPWALPADPPPADNLDNSVQVGPFGQINLHAKDQDITRILQLLSIQSQRNIIVTRGVSGSVTVDLYNVDFYQALDAILHPNGFGYLEKGDIIYVYTQDQLKAIRDAERKPITRVVRLNYISAEDAKTFLEPLVSKDGKITISSKVSSGFQPSTSDGGANSFAHTETLVIRDYPENVEEMLAVLKEIDIRPKQVLIEATILEAKLTELNAFGVNISVLADFSFAELGGPDEVFKNILAGIKVPPSSGGSKILTGSGQAIGWNNILEANDQSFRIGILSDNVAAFIDALDKVTDTTVLANPKLLVLNRQKANILVGEKKGYVSTTQTETATTQTVEFLEVGTKLTLRPFVADDDMIRMEIKPEISSGEVTQVGTTNVVVPNSTNEELTTNIMVRSGQTVVLGGLFKESTTVSRKQVPGVGDIPLVGAAFKGQSDSVTRNEYIFLITPTVIKDESLYAAGGELKDSAELARIGAREGLLPWSRSRMVSAHVRDAWAAYKAGDTRKALWLVNMALSLDPTFMEARRLQEQITSQRLYTPTDSAVQDAIRRLIDQKLQEESLEKLQP